MCKAVLIILIAIFITPVQAIAEFELNLSPEEFAKETDALTVGDLGVGEFALIGNVYIQFCEFNDKMMLSKDTFVLTEKPEYGTYYKVRRLPKNKVSIEILSSEPREIKNAFINFIKSNILFLYSCDSLSIDLYGISRSPSDLLTVKEVEGCSSLKGLLEKAKILY